MKKERSYNTYFWNNISESKQLVVYAQSEEKHGTEEQVIRIVSKDSLRKLTDTSPKSNNGDKEFMAYDAVTTNDRTLTLPSVTKLTVQCLKLVTIAIKGTPEDILFVATSSGVFIYHSNFGQLVSLYDRFIQYTFTGITDNGSNVYLSHYGGQIDKIVSVVARL